LNVNEGGDIVEEGGEVGDGVGDPNFGGEGSNGKGRELGWEGKGGEAEEDVVGDGGKRTTVDDGEGPPFVPEGIGGRVMELAGEGEPWEAAGGVVVAVGVEAEVNGSEEGDGLAESAAGFIPGEEVGVEADVDTEVTGGIGGDKVVGEVVEGGKEGAEILNGGGVEGNEYALGEVEVKA